MWLWQEACWSRAPSGPADPAVQCAQVQKARADPAIERIVFTGHSLGGAVALLAYLWARANPGPLPQQEVSRIPCPAADCMS